MEKRTCNGCTACCKTHGILEIMKVPNLWCTYCKVGEGCGIYGKRPEECRTFTCSWLSGVGGSEFRPDKIGVVPEFKKIPGIGIVMSFWEYEEGALESALLKSWSKRNLLAGNHVLHSPIIGNPRLYLPKHAKSPDRDFVMEHSKKKVELIRFSEKTFQVT